MRSQLLFCFLTCLFHGATLNYLPQHQRLDDVSSFLELFEEEGNNHIPQTQNPSAAVVRRKSEEKKGKKEKCACKDRAAKRLRREIKDISFQDCPYQGIGLDEERKIQLSNVTITPTPLIAPGNLFINFNLEVREQLPADIQIDVDVYKYMFDTLPVHVPCMDVYNMNGLTLGSCTYRNMCRVIEKSACPAFQSNDVPCDCGGITPGLYHFRTPLTFIVPNINSIFDILVKGSYKMRMAFTDARTKKEFGCISAKWKITKVHKDKESSYRTLFFKRRNHR